MEEYEQVRTYPSRFVLVAATPTRKQPAPETESRHALPERPFRLALRCSVVDVFEVDLGEPDLVPCLPGDADDDQREQQADDRVGDLCA